ncbi:Type II secretion system protein M [Gammaproteobacteria bacterium]
MNAWWESLSARERGMLSLALGITIIATLYFAVWEPFQVQLRTLRQTVTDERSQVFWMEQATAEVIALRGVVPVQKNNGESLLTLVDRSARVAGMGAGINRVEPEGKEKVRVWLNDIAFDTLIPWLAGLDKIQGVVPESLVVDRQGAAGQVNVRLVLVGGGV